MLAVIRLLKESVINIGCDVEIASSRIELPCKTLIVGGCYCPPGYTEEFGSGRHQCIKYFTNK